MLLPLLGHKQLTSWDEGIYAEVSREMLTHGWLVPHWNGQLWFEKPPLMLWITAAFFRLFGVGEFWARAGSALSGVALVALLHGWLLTRQSRMAAWLGTVILLSTFGFLHVCRVGELDVLLSLGCCIALCGLSAVAEHNRTGWLLFWGGFAVAAMTKGSASIVLLLTLVVIAVVDRWNWRRFNTQCWLGLLLFLALVLPWHLLLVHRYGQAFLGEYLGYHALTRATQAIEGHVTHGWYYLWVLLVSAAPWVLLYPLAVFQALRRPALRPALRVWAIFPLVVVGFFSVVQTRLPHYIAPAYPALAVVTASLLADWIEATLRQHRPARTRAIFGVAALAISIGSILLTAGPRSRLHRARVEDGQSPQSEKEAATLLAEHFSHPVPETGPVMVWWRGNTRSIATSVFYSGRQVRQIAPPAPAPNAQPDRYTFNPVSFDQAITRGPHILLLEKALVPLLPPKFTYTPLAVGRTLEVGTIQRSSDLASQLTPVPLVAAP